MQVRKYHALHGYDLGRLNNRTHRKILVVVIDPAFAAEQTRHFEEDLALARPISFAQWSDRPLCEKIGDRLAALVGAQLQRAA